MKVATLGLVGVFFLLFSGIVQGQEAQRVSLAPQELVASACQRAEEAFSAGDVDEGCKTLLETLRSLDPERGELVDLTTQPMHLLVFGMSSLLLDESLAEFLADSIDPQANPIDEAVLLFFNLQYDSVAEGRGVPAAPMAEQVVRAQRMAQSPHALVRALGLTALSWYAPGGTVGESSRAALNDLAALCPTAKSTREVLHRLLLVSANTDPVHSQALRDLITRSDWSPAVQTLMADDPVVGLVREFTAPSTEGRLEAQKSGVAVNPVDESLAPVLSAAQKHSEAEVKDWCLRLVHANAGAGNAGTKAFCEAVQVQDDAAAKSGAAKSKTLSTATVSVQPLETLRARHVLFSQALAAKDLTAAGTQLDALLSASSAEEPLDSITTFNVLMDAVEYGMRLVMAGEYSKAQTVYEQIAAKYPNSDVGRRSEEHIEHIKAVLASQAK